MLFKTVPKSKIPPILPLPILKLLINSRNFSMDNLGQFKTVYEKCYSFQQEKLKIDNKEDFHLIINPIFEKGNF